MNAVLKNYLKYAQTLNNDQLIEEGKVCSVRLIGTVMDLNTGVINSQELFENKMTAIMITLCHSTLYNGISENEIEFICKTTSFDKEIIIDSIKGLAPANILQASKNTQEVVDLIYTTFKDKDEILTLAKYIILLCAVDGNITWSEKQFVGIFNALLH